MSNTFLLVSDNMTLKDLSSYVGSSAVNSVLNLNNLERKRDIAGQVDKKFKDTVSQNTNNVSWKRKQEILNSRYLVIYEKVMNYCDAVGLGIFTVVGVYNAYCLGYRQKFFLVFLGMLTGIGGGVIRDVLADTMPFILHKHIYAVAALAGALVCTLLIRSNLYFSMAAGAAVIILIRMLASRFCWDLPKPQHETQRKEEKG